MVKIGGTWAHSALTLGLGATVMVAACANLGEVELDADGLGGAKADDVAGTGSSFSLGSGGAPAAKPRVACANNTDCAITQICAATDLGGFCKDSLGDCADSSECQGDSFCCSGDCRLDAAPDGVCIPFDSDNPQNLSCMGDVPIGVMAPSLQCSWTAPPADDPYPDSKAVFGTPIVIDTPYDAGDAGEVIFVTSESTKDAGAHGIIRIISGQDCSQLALVGTAADGISESATPAVADVDGDGKIEIFVRTSLGTSAFFYEGGGYVKKWTQGPASAPKTEWDGVSIYDLNDDGVPEIVGRHGLVHNALTGDVLHGGSAGSPVTSLGDPVVGDVDGDGKVELVADAIYSWTGSGWNLKYPGATGGVASFYAFADFGTAGAAAAQFDRSKLDGKAEIVVTGGGVVAVYTLDGQELMHVTAAPSGTLSRGGPPTVSDFDGDGRVEIASAGDVEYRVWDLDCAGTPSGCAGEMLLWSSPTKDASSAQTGSSVFDFDADGKAEVVYSDECYLRVYDGTNGDVLYSAPRTSCTWWENPTVADPDKDSRSEILVGMNPNCGSATQCYGDAYKIDPVDPGLRCEYNEDCASGICDAGLCRCSSDDDCGAQWVSCTAPLDGAAGSGMVCRARELNPYDNSQNPDQEFLDLYGVRIYRDRLDRWASSRPIWNQHAYNVTNISDDQTAPRSSERPSNISDPDLNNFRQNRQGKEAAGLLPDITGGLDQDNLCSSSTNGAQLTAQVCNRGLRTVGADMPATFYLGEVKPENILCISYTQGVLKEGTCLPVECTVNTALSGGSVVTMVVNDDGTGRGATTEECIYDNNEDSVTITGCTIR